MFAKEFSELDRQMDALRRFEGWLAGRPPGNGQRIFEGVTVDLGVFQVGTHFVLLR